MVSIIPGLGVQPKVSKDDRFWSRENFEVLISVLVSKQVVSITTLVFIVTRRFDIIGSAVIVISNVC